MSIPLPLLLVKPPQSLQAKNAAESAYPGLWKGLVLPIAKPEAAKEK